MVDAPLAMFRIKKRNCFSFVFLNYVTVVSNLWIFDVFIYVHKCPSIYSMVWNYANIPWGYENFFIIIFVFFRVELCYEFSPLASASRVGRGARGEGGTGPAVPAGPPLEGGAGLKVLRALRPFPGSQEGRQEDAEEFLGCLLNSLNDEMLEVRIVNLIKFGVKRRSK